MVEHRERESNIEYMVNRDVLMLLRLVQDQTKQEECAKLSFSPSGALKGGLMRRRAPNSETIVVSEKI